MTSLISPTTTPSAPAALNEKECNTCKLLKPLSDFHNDRRKPDGKISRCKPCKAAYDQKYFSQQHIQARRKTPEARSKQRDWGLQKRYGLDHAQYQRMLARQGGHCACCSATPEQESSGVLMVDHCHTTGQVRGLLCNKCNLTLGNVNDDFNRLRELANYVQVHRDRPA